MEREHLAWVDVLRILACAMVLISHSCDFFVAQFDANRFEFLSGAAWGSLVRPCVPLFVMISGVLLLPVRSGMFDFYKKRMKRVVWPLIFWSLVLPLMFFGYLSAVGTLSPTIAMEEHTLAATLRKLYLFVFNFNYDTIPFWYLYMLIGLYLFIPIIGSWLAQATQKEIRFFIRAWLVSLCLPYVQLIAPALGYQGNYGNMGLLGVCDWNPYGTLYYFAGFLGYIVLAHYLVRFPDQRSMGRTLARAIPCFLAGYGITLAGFLITQKYYPGNYSWLEIFWYFSGINVFLMTYAVFTVVQKLRVMPSKGLTAVAGLTFGIYLCHFVFVQAGYDLIHTWLHVPPYLQIPAIALLAGTVSGLLIRGMKKVKGLGIVTG